MILASIGQILLLYGLPFLVVLTVVVTVHELGHFLVARWCGVAVDRFSIGFGRAIVRWTDKSGVEWRIGWMPFGGYVRFAGDADASSSAPNAETLAELRREIAAREGVGAERKYFHFKPLWQRTLVVLAGPAANFILSVVLFALLLLLFGEPGHRPRIGSVQPDSPAARAGLKPGDLVTAADGRPIGDFSDLQTFTALRAGEPVRLTVQRGAQAFQIVATPERRLLENKVSGASAKLGVLGIGSSAAPGDVFHRTYNPVEAIGGGAARSWSQIETTVFYLSRIVRGRESGDQLGSFIGIAKASGEFAHAGAYGEKGLGAKTLGVAVALATLIAALSVNIGFANLLPVPVLDGGHLLFYAYEAAARRPLGAKVQAAGYRVGLALLLSFVLFATWNDLQQLRVFKFLGGLFS
jgi:regulator of sigma E protease